MTSEDHLFQYLELTKRVFLRMQEENSWPWQLEDETVQEFAKRLSKNEPNDLQKDD